MSLLGRDPSGTRSVLARIVCGAPCNRSCPLNRQGTAAAAAHPYTSCFSKGCSSTVSCTPLQHLLGNKAQTQAHTHTHTRAHTHTHAHTHIHSHACACAHTHTYAHMHAHIHTYKHKRARIRIGVHTHVHMHTHKHTDARVHTHTNAQTHRHTHARTHTHAHMHMHAHVAHVMGFANFPASLATLPHLSSLLVASGTGYLLLDLCVWVFFML
jgi:hypothetical protein